MKFQKKINIKKKIIVICNVCNKHLIKPKRDIFKCPCKNNIIYFVKKEKNINQFYIL